MKGAILPDHIPVNKYKLLVIGMPPLTPIEVSGIEEEIQTIELPDRSIASGGNTLPIEFTMMIPIHHSIEHAAMEAWFIESQEPVSPGYKKLATLQMPSLSGANVKSYTIVELFPSKRGLPDLEMANEGEMAAVTWTMKATRLLPI